MSLPASLALAPARPPLAALSGLSPLGDVHTPSEARLDAMQPAHLDQVLAIEEQAYSHPWTRGNFMDSLNVGYHCQCLMGPGQPGHREDTVIGYFVAMKGVDEVHLLNITVAPTFQRQGWAPLMLEALTGWARAQRAFWLWLEVRQSNARAQAVYERHGFHRVGVRKAYYPAAQGRENAIVMSLRLDAPHPEMGAAKP